MPNDRYTFLRDWIALAIVAIACPASLLGGTLLSCVGQGGLTTECATGAITVTPFVLFLAGVLSGIITRGWTGLFAIFIGTVLGMTAILFLSFADGRPVPVDLFSGAIATIWFFGPIVIGYAVGRAGMRVRRILQERGRASGK
jgi:lysylphosphatidylglycerol synthetase-like protein (DUF2156 family)